MNRLNEEKLAAARIIATAVDNLDRNECDESSVMTAISFVMTKGFGYPEVESTAAAFQLTTVVLSEFQATYWREATASHKFASLMGIVQTAIKIKEDGQINEKVLNAVRQEIEKSDAKS